MSLEKSSIAWSAKQISGMIKTGKIDFNHIVQRSFVWERKRKSALIESMILGYPIPPVFAKRICGENTTRGNNVYYIMDGKQRLSTVKEYLNDEFPLTELSVVKYYDEELGVECEDDISGLKFSELPEAIKDHLQTTSFSITYFDNLTGQEEKELFKRLNAGKPLSSKSRLLASCKDINGMIDIGNNEMFSEMLTKKAMENKNQVTLVMKSWVMLNNDINDVYFESKSFNPIVENIEISDDNKVELNNVFSYIKNVHGILMNGNKRVAKKIYTETHMISLIPFIKTAIQRTISEDMFSEWIMEFFGTENSSASISDAYNLASESGSAKHSNIVNRNNSLESSFNIFFKED